MATVPLTATFATGGTWSWTCPAGVTSVTVACTGAGGGGGGAAVTSGDQGGGGGGGEAAAEPSVNVTAGLPYVVTVGAGGAGGSKGGNGSAGGDTSFTGDAGLVVYAHGGQGAPSGTPTAAGPGAPGGTGSGNTISAAGGAGDDGTPGTSGGGGGGAAGTSSTTGFPGNPGNGSTAGAASLGTWPGGAGGNGGTGTFGANGSGPGGGGGGGESAGTFEAGGNGADGQVVISWTMNDPVTLSASTAGSVTKFQAPLGAGTVTAQAWGGGAGGFDATGGTSYLIGATIGDHVYGTNAASAISHFNDLTGLTLANSVTKIYLEPEATWPTTVDSQTQARISAGCKLVICMKPSRAAAVSGGSALTAERTNMANYIQLIQGATSILPDVVLWQEPNGKDSSGPFFANAGVYQNYVTAYAPVARNPTTYVTTGTATACPLVYCPLMGTGTSWDPVAGYPGDTYVDKIIADFYGTAHKNGVRLDSPGPFAASLTSVADAHSGGPIPLGLGEWNAAAGGGSVTNDQWDTYVSYLISVFSARIAAGKPLGDLIFWMGNNAIGVTINLITATTDFKIPGSANTGTSPTGLTPFAAALAPGAASGGAGGGGGEYAQESSLAVTGLKNYTIAVGAGGARRASGTNTTIAGDSVTVTAHGGSVATSNGTGGAGGTGSGNTTHFAGGAGGGGAASGGGGGGGGSGGTAAGGNAGAAGTAAAGGAGGTAVTGGGPGGTGGSPAVNGSPPLSGPGGGGGGRGVSGTVSGGGYDGQITLSSFTSHPGAAGGMTLAPLRLSGTVQAGSAGASFALAPLAGSGTAAVCDFTLVQIGPALQASGGPLTLTNPSTAGTNLVAKIVSSGTSAMSLPAGWVNVASQNAGGAAGRAEIWFLGAQYNPGGISSVTVTGGTLVRGNLAEWSCPGFTMAADGTPGTASGTGPATSFTVSTPGSAAAADLAVGLFLDEFSSAPSSAWSSLTTGWTTEKSQATVTDNWRSVYLVPGASSGVQTVASNFGTSTNQTGWAVILAAFTAVPLATSTSGVALAPLALSGSVNVGVGPTQNVSTGALALAPLGFQSPSLATTFGVNGNSPLPIRVEILVNGAWADISDYVYQRDGISISGRGRPNEASTAQPAQVTMTLNNRDGSFSPQNTAGQFSPFLARNTQIRISVVNAVTPQGAWYTGYRFWGEVPAWPPLWDPSGADVYVSITAAGVLQRMQQSKYSASPVTRYYTNIINAANAGPGQGALVPAAYWSCEDATNSASFTSNLPGGSPMTWTGSPGLGATDSSGPGGTNQLPGVASFAQLSGSVWTGTPGVFTSGGITYATPGTYQWTCPGNVTSVQAECWGGGGGGGNGQLGTSGGGGEYAASAVAVTPGTVYTVVVGAGGNGGAGSFASSGARGGNGRASTFTGDTTTVTAHGGQGGTSSGGNGGTGSGNTTHNDGGGGRNGPTSGHGGSGGGGSGGTSSAGNTGNRASSNSGAGGASAVTGGGPGGAGGNGSSTSQGAQATAGLMPSPGPGGGGGGGGFSGYNGFGRAGGNGYAGQVRLTFGTSGFPPANVVRAVIDVPSGGGTDQANLLSFTTSGDVANAQLSYHTTGGGSLQFAGHDSHSNTLFDSGVQTFGANGKPMLVSCELTTTGGGGFSIPSIHWKVTAITPGATTAVATFKGTFTGSSWLGSVTQVSVNNTVGHTDNGSTGVGQITVQYAVDPILHLSQALNAYTGELAATRFMRLCGEQSVPVTLSGNVTDTPQMGPQPTGLLVDLLQDCENADLGQMYERRDTFGLGYATRISLQNQAAAAVLDYARAQLAQGLTPTDDDQLTRNDIIATRGNGSITGTSYETLLTTGTLSVQDPPNGVGLYSYPVTVNLFADSQLANFAAWLLTLGTLDEFRYPVITIDLSRAEVSDGTFGAAASLDIGSFLQIINPPAWLPQMPVNQLCFGFSETLNAFTWTISVNAVPADPYLTGSGNSSSPPPTW